MSLKYRIINLGKFSTLNGDAQVNNGEIKSDFILDVYDNDTYKITKPEKREESYPAVTDLLGTYIEIDTPTYITGSVDDRVKEIEDTCTEDEWKKISEEDEKADSALDNDEVDVDTMMKLTNYEQKCSKDADATNSGLLIHSSVYQKGGKQNVPPLFLQNDSENQERYSLKDNVKWLKSKKNNIPPEFEKELKKIKKLMFLVSEWVDMEAKTTVKFKLVDGEYYPDTEEAEPEEPESGVATEEAGVATEEQVASVIAAEDPAEDPAEGGGRRTKRSRRGRRSQRKSKRNRRSRSRSRRGRRSKRGRGRGRGRLGSRRR